MTAPTPGPDRVALLKAHSGLIDAVRVGDWNMVADVVEQMRPAIEARDTAPMLADALLAHQLASTYAADGALATARERRATADKLTDAALKEAGL